MAEQRDYGVRGRLAYVEGLTANGMIIAISPDRTEGIVEIGGQQLVARDPATIDVALRGLRELRRRLVVGRE